MHFPGIRITMMNSRRDHPRAGPLLMAPALKLLPLISSVPIF
jgi:hypothetical protein